MSMRTSGCTLLSVANQKGPHVGPFPNWAVGRSPSGHRITSTGAKLQIQEVEPRGMSENELRAELYQNTVGLTETLLEIAATDPIAAAMLLSGNLRAICGRC